MHINTQSDMLCKSNSGSECKLLGIAVGLERVREILEEMVRNTWEVKNTKAGRDGE